MLREVLNAFEEAGPLSLAQLARRLDVEPGTLDDMIQFWVNKGKLREASNPGCAACGIQHGCPIVTTMPRRYERVPNEGSRSDTDRPCQYQC